MKISVVVVCYNEEKRIGACLDALARQEYIGDFEVLVVDNNSSDKTREIVSKFVDEAANFRLEINPRRGIAISRNVGIKSASYPFVAFTDADCIVPADWLTKLSSGFLRHDAEEGKVAAVGGANVAPSGENDFYDSVNITLKTLLGNRGSTQGMEFGRDCEVDHMPTLNILYSKQAVLSVGGFDEAFLFVCEDPDLNCRLRKAGYRIIYLHDASIVHAFRPGLTAWSKTVFTYGRGRTQLIRKHPDLFNLVYLVPPVILIFPLVALGAPILGGVLALPFAFYIAAIFIYALFHCTIRGRWRLLFPVFIIYCVTQISYGTGQIVGFFSPQPRHNLDSPT